MKGKKTKKKKLKRKGFTLIELLAVIVIMGILMLVAIPAISRVIENSRKDTFVDIAKSYVNAARNLWTTDNLTCEGRISSAVDDGDYYILINTKDTAKDHLPVLLDQGGKSSWGNRDVNGYVRVNVKTTDGVDSNGDGKYEVEPKRTTKFYVALTDGTHGLIDDNSKVSDNLVRGDINMNLSEEELKKVQLTVDDGRLDCAIDAEGKYSCTGVTPITDITGICVDDNTSVGVTGRVEVDNTLLVNQIKNNNPLITSPPTLTTSIKNSSDESGLYSSTLTNSGNETYYFRGVVTNNYVSFAGFIWRIVRIDEDGTIRLIMQDGINDNTEYRVYSTESSYKKLYYSNSDIKETLENWYQTNITDKNFDKYVSTSEFCEQAKVTGSSDLNAGAASLKLYTSYTPNFKCSADANGYGKLNLKVGLLSYDEFVYAGSAYDEYDIDFYLNIRKPFWGISPYGFGGSWNSAYIWCINYRGGSYSQRVGDYRVKNLLRPVINLKANVKATGTGTSSDPYVIITE